jgi:hypothetical protein
VDADGDGVRDTVTAGGRDAVDLFDGVADGAAEVAVIVGVPAHCFGDQERTGAEDGRQTDRADRRLAPATGPAGHVRVVASVEVAHLCPSRVSTRTLMVASERT